MVLPPFVIDDSLAVISTSQSYSKHLVLHNHLVAIRNGLTYFVRIFLFAARANNSLSCLGQSGAS